MVGVDLRRHHGKIKNRPDLVLVLGGDGALLAASHRLDGHRPPVIGVNFGSVGFLAAVAPDRIEEILEDVLNGKGRCENRAMMRVQVKRKGKMRLDTHILNDVVLSRGPGASLLGIQLHADRRPVCSYRGDGLVLSTATGSTALQPFGRRPHPGAQPGSLGGDAHSPSHGGHTLPRSSR